MARRRSGRQLIALGALAAAIATIVIGLLGSIRYPLLIALSFVAIAAVFEGVILVVTTSRIAPMSAMMTKDPRTDGQSPAQHVADSQDLMRVQGARVNNLKDVSVKLPKDRAGRPTKVEAELLSMMSGPRLSAAGPKEVRRHYG